MQSISKEIGGRFIEKQESKQQLFNDEIIFYSNHFADRNNFFIKIFKHFHCIRKTVFATLIHE